MRILVTGSRNWTDEEIFWKAIADLIQFKQEQHIVVHGACPDGLDAIAEKYGESGWYETEPHPAKWKEQGWTAGPIRNTVMVSHGADICLAFLMKCQKPNCYKDPHYSHGTTDCMIKAEKAGIPVRKIFGESLGEGTEIRRTNGEDDTTGN